MTKISDLSRPQLALAAIASVGVVVSTLQLNSVNDDLLGLGRINKLYNGLRRAKVGNINAPYAPYKGELEPRSHRQLSLPPGRELALYTANDDGTNVTCSFGATLGPDAIPEDVEFVNTIVVGYPGADKRMVLRQMEAMTGLSGRDAWDMQYLGMTRQPFVKTNYPHHEGIWGWQEHADQVMLVVRNIRTTIDEYHDILSDINYAKTWQEATEFMENLYKGDLEDDAYVRWRDERTMDEIGWYGWLIDYWMEGGILRDYFDHKLTTKEHWAKLRAPETFTYGELQWDVNICTTDPLPGVDYDEVCDPAVLADCKAKVIISAERLMDPATGHEEHRKIGMLLNQTDGMADYLVNETAWDCLYDLIVANNTDGIAPEGTEDYNDYRIREGYQTRKHIVSTRHLNKMVQQLTRLINKYSAADAETGIDWTVSEQALFLVEILTEHRAEIQAELDATDPLQVWAHPPKPNWVVFPRCAAESRRVWDYDYPHEFSGYVLEMFPDVV